MTNPATDLEEQHMAEIGRAALAWREDGASGEELHELIDAYRDRRAKASAPKPERCEPPEGAAYGSKWHLERQPIIDGQSAWTVGEWICGLWYTLGRRDGQTPESAASAGWSVSGSVSSPALPNTPQIPTHESIIQWAKEKDKESLRTGKALKWTELIPDFARVFGLLDAAKCYSSTTHLSNETLRDLWRLAHQEALDQFVTDAKRVVGR